MSTAQEASNKATIRRFQDATNTHDPELISNEIFIFRFRGGRIAESWGVVDVRSQMKQLGVTPA